MAAAKKPQETTPTAPKGRVETYTAARPDGTKVTVTRNIDTGETSLSEQ